MSVPKLSIMVVLLLLASLARVVVSTVDPSDPADTCGAVKNPLHSHGSLLSEEASHGAPQRIGHLHLEGRGGSDKATLAVRGDNLRIPRFADHEGAWHASADDVHGHQTPQAPMSCDDDHDYSRVISGQVRLKDLRAGKDPMVDAMAKLARSTARTLVEDRLGVFSRILEQGREPADVWKIMSCAVLISEQNGGAWTSKEAMQLRSFGLFSREDVLKELGMIAWPNDCSEPITLDRDSL